MKRHIWCRTKGELQHGRVEPAPDKAVSRWQRLFGLHRKGGTIAFELVELSTALRALERFYSSSKEFAIETSNGTKIDFFTRKHSEEVSLDFWFLESDLSQAVVTKAIAQQMLEKNYSNATDTEVADFVRSHAVTHC